MSVTAIYFRIRKAWYKSLEIITFLALFALLVTMLLQIFFRFFACPFSLTAPIATMLLMWIAFPAACLGLETRMQLGFDLLYHAVPQVWRRGMDIFTGACIALFAASAMLYGGGKACWYLYGSRQYLRLLYYLPLCFSGGFMVLQGVERIYRGVSGVPPQTEKIKIQGE